MATGRTYRLALEQGSGRYLPEEKSTGIMPLRRWLSTLRLRRVLVADGGDDADFPHAAENVCSNVGTPRVVTEVFCQKFFAPVRRCQARLDRYLRNGEPLTEYRTRRASCASDFLTPPTRTEEH